MPHHLRRCLLALILLVPGPAAIAEEAPAQTETPAAAPEVIPAAEVPSRADIDERFAQDVIRRSRERNSTDTLESSLATLGRSVRELAQLFKSDELRVLPVIRLESLERHWRFYRRQFDAWKATLSESSSRYLEDGTDLGRRRAVWKVTRANLEANNAPDALLDRITAVDAQLAQAEAAASGPLNEQIHLGERANALDANIDAGQRAVAAAIAYNDRRLTQIDAPALWDQQTRAGANGNDTLATGLKLEANFAKEYGKANALARRAYNIFELVLLPLLIWLSIRVRRSTSDHPDVQAAARVLRRPLSSWLLLVAMGLVVVEPDAPILLHQFALFVALIPVLRLLPPRVYEVLGPWPYMVSGLYLLRLLGFLFLSNAFYHRCYLLFVTLLTLCLLLWRLLRSRSQASSAPAAISTATRIVREAGWVAIAVLTVSALANVFGNVSLAEMLTDALLLSAYVALVLYAAVHVLTSMLGLMVARNDVARLRMMTRHGGTLVRSATRLLQITAFAGWVVITLSQFRVFRPIYDWVRHVLTYSLTFGQISLTPGGVLLFVFSVLLAFWVAKTIRLVLHDEILPNMSLPRGVANSVSSLTYYGVIIAGMFFALAASGFEISQLAFVIGALGVGIGLGLQGVVNNFVSGLILMFERPIQPGDVIEVTGTAGKVREIGMRATTLTTFEGADVVVPNGTLLSEKLTNWTLSNMNRRLEVNVGVAYGTDPKKVLALLMDVTKETPGVAHDPEPGVLFVGFGASSLDFTIRAWTNNYGDWVNTRSNLAVRVHDAIVAAGIEIPFPQQDLHLRSVSSEVHAALGQPAQPRSPPPPGEEES